MRKLPKTTHPLVIRTDFGNEQAWKKVCKVLRAPADCFGVTIEAHLEFLEDESLAGLTTEQLTKLAPGDYEYSFLFVVDAATLAHKELTVLVIDIESVQSFRALPSQIPGIENNLSVANMGFEEFAQTVDSEGVFRGFPGL
jgi:hypothetical protein